MRLCTLCFFLVALFIISLPVRGQDLDPNEVRKAIHRGIEYLKRHQGTDGRWNYDTSDRTGSTALSIIAMVSCGIPANDPAVERGMKYLRLFPGEKAGRNYSLSLQTMAFCLVDPKRDLPLIRANVKLLERNQVGKGSEHSGGWYYSPGGLSDLSNSQFSILALYEAERAGVSAIKESWRDSHQYWERTQNSNGAWGYTPQKGGSGNPRGSMTCAGIASLIVTSGILDRSRAEVRGDHIICFQEPNKAANASAERIQRGIDWLAKNFSVSTNPNYGSYLYYYLYALERVGRMTNQRFIDQHDWYRAGTDKLLNLQDQMDGGWHGLGTDDLSSTAFALLFLSKGRRPVLMSKIQYGDNDTWNLHPNDANNLTLHAESRWKVDMTWQTIDIVRATADHLLQSPVIYFSGNQSPVPANDAAAAELVAKLREYLDQGGFIVAEAQSKDKSFDRGFRDLMSRVFPEPGYELALLERTHPIWTAEMPIDPNQIRPIEGINYGCRTNVVYIPPVEGKPSLSCIWEVANPFQREVKHHEAVQKQIDAGLGIGLNILAYATNRELKFKDEIAETVTKKKIDTDRRGRIFLSFLDYGGATNPAPHAPQNVLYYLEDQLGLAVEPHTEAITPTSSELAESPILFMHGRSKFEFSAEQRKALRKYLENGGFLFANAICSAKAFSDSFAAEMKATFPDATLQKIEMTDPIFSDNYGGFKTETLELRHTERSPGRKTVTTARNVQPELYGIRLSDSDRWIVVFSPYDVSCALEKASSIECQGYTQKSALQLAANVILYAVEHW